MLVVAIDWLRRAFLGGDKHNSWAYVGEGALSGIGVGILLSGSFAEAVVRSLAGAVLGAGFSLWDIWVDPFSRLERRPKDD